MSTVYQAAPRHSFVVALKDIPEMWEVFYGKDAPQVIGLAHSYEKGMVEAVAKEERFPIRRIELSQPLDDFFFDPDYRHVVGSARDGDKAVIVHLDVRREIAELPFPACPISAPGSAGSRRPPGAGDAAPEGGRRQRHRHGDVAGDRAHGDARPGFFMRSHENSPYAWVDVFLGPHRDAVHVIDKRAFEIVKRCTRPAKPRRTSSSRAMAALRSSASGRWTARSSSLTPRASRRCGGSRW